MQRDRTRKNLALLVGDELEGRSRRRLEARLGNEPELAEELEELREVRRLYTGLARHDVPAAITAAARSHLRTRVMARVREETGRKEARSWFARPVFAAGAVAACILVVGLAVLLQDAAPVDTRSEVPVALDIGREHPGLEMYRYDVKVKLADGPTGPVLRWTNGGENARFVVLRSTRPGQEERLAVVRGHEWADTEAPATGLLRYRVVRLPEST